MKGEAWERVFLTDAAQNGAVCLDGSPGAYYIRTNTTTGHTTDPSKWIIFMEGGGWCANNEGCLGRSHSDLGSSKVRLMASLLDKHAFIKTYSCSFNPTPLSHTRTQAIPS